MVRFIGYRVLWGLRARQCLKLEHIHLGAVPQTGAGNVSQTVSNSFGQSDSNCDTIRGDSASNWGWKHISNWVKFIWRQCLKLVHIHLETMPETGTYSLGDSASNWDIFSWRQCLKLGHIHLETVPQTGAGNMSQTGSNSYGDSDSTATQL